MRQVACVLRWCLVVAAAAHGLVGQKPDAAEPSLMVDFNPSNFRPGPVTLSKNQLSGYVMLEISESEAGGDWVLQSWLPPEVRSEEVADGGSRLGEVTTIRHTKGELTIDALSFRLRVAAERPPGKVPWRLILIGPAGSGVAKEVLVWLSVQDGSDSVTRSYEQRTPYGRPDPLPVQVPGGDAESFGKAKVLRHEDDAASMRPRLGARFVRLTAADALSARVFEANEHHGEVDLGAFRVLRCALRVPKPEGDAQESPRERVVEFMASHSEHRGPVARAKCTVPADGAWHECIVEWDYIVAGEKLPQTPDTWVRAPEGHLVPGPPQLGPYAETIDLQVDGSLDWDAFALSRSKAANASHSLHAMQAVVLDDPSAEALLEVEAALAKLKIADRGEDALDRLVLEQFIAWLRADAQWPHEDSGQPVSRERFEAMLRHRHGLDLSAEDLIRIGTEQVSVHQGMLTELAEKIAPGKGWRHVVEMLKDDHPTAEELPAMAERMMQEALEFTLEKDLVTVPMAARHGVIGVHVDGPISRTYPFGGYGGARRSPEGFTGTYFVCPPAVWMDEAQSVDRMRGNHRTWTRVVALHELVPGHHLQTVRHRLQPLAPLRQLSRSTVFSEGWALYCEDMMFEAGFFPDVESRFTQLHMRLWRAARIVIDASLHGGGMSPDAAADFLVREVAFDAVNAESEVRRYIGNPCRPMSYLMGFLAIRDLEAAARAAAGGPFDAKAFRDRLLSFGPLPVAWIRVGMGL